MKSKSGIKYLLDTAIFAVIGMLSLPAQAFCGFYAGKADATLYNEASQVILVRDGDRTVLSMLNDYQGPLDEFALIVPTPVALKQGQVRVAEKAIFERLDAYSSPRLAEYFDANPCTFQFDWGRMRPEIMMRNGGMIAMAAPARMDSARDAALGVTVEARYTLEEYDIVSLSAKQSDGLETWLTENGYKIPKGASVALKPYINQGMKFFVAKVNLKEQKRIGFNYLRPLQFAFESEKFMLPMRLGMLNAPPGKAQDLIVYALTRNGRVESSNYRTLKLPSNVNLPPAIKPKFGEFYKALFAKQATAAQNKAVFTEYFWDMGWCDPCDDNPLSTQELLKAGAFWVGGNEQEMFETMRGAAAPGTRPEPAGSNSSGSNPTGANSASPVTSTSPTAKMALPRPIMPGGGAQPVMLSRLHIRYTPESLSEDLMFTQTGDRQNWQSRYVLQQPFKGDMASCSADIDKQNCSSICSERVSEIKNLIANKQMPAYVQIDSQDPDMLGSCVKACQQSKRDTLSRAQQYYERQLPERMAKERETLAELTGWSDAEIQKILGAASPAPKPTRRSWWEKLFERSSKN